MSAPLRLAAFAIVLVVVFLAAFGVGRIGADSPHESAPQSSTVTASSSMTVHVGG